MINWISANNPPKECSAAEEYLVTVKYDGRGNTNGRKTMFMTYQEKGKKKIPTWCWYDRISIWEVLYWAELPEPCQE